VAVVSESFAREWLSGMEPIAARLLVDDNDGRPRPLEVVGIVGDVQQIALDSPATWDIYLPYAQVHADNIGLAAGNMFWLVRTPGAPMTLATAVAQAVRRVDAGVAASEIRPLDSYVNDSLSPRRFGLVLMSAFAITALALAVTGIFAVVACAIRERTRELGIRSALGATLSSLARLVSGSVAGAAGVGLIAGLVLAAGTARLLDSLLFDVAALDLATFVEVGVAVAGFTLLACLAPAAQLNRVQSRPHRALAAIVD